MKLTFQNMIDEVLYGRKTKPKKKKPATSEDANIPTPQDFGTMALAKRKTKKKKTEPKEDKVVKEQIETAIETSKKKPEESESPSYEDVIEQTRQEQAYKKGAGESDIKQLADSMSHLIKDEHPVITNNPTPPAATHMWWIKKGTEFGLAAFANTGEGFYDESIKIKWLPSNKKVVDGGEQEYSEYLIEKNLPAIMPLSKTASGVIKSQVTAYAKQYTSSDGTPLDKVMITEINEQIISAMTQLPVRPATRKLTETEAATVLKVATDLTGMLIENKDMPKMKKIAKDALNKNA